MLGDPARPVNFPLAREYAVGRSTGGNARRCVTLTLQLSKNTWPNILKWGHVYYTIQHIVKVEYKLHLNVLHFFVH